MAKYIIITFLALLNVYMMFLVKISRADMTYQRMASDRAIQEINSSWFDQQNVIDRQARLIHELAAGCGSKYQNRKLSEEDLMRWR